MALGVGEDRHTLTRQLISVVNSKDLVLFLKGTPSFPLCGFSGTICHLFKQYNLDFFYVNVLKDPDMYHFLRHLNFPEVIPYLYVHGQFFGGYEKIVDTMTSGITVTQSTFLKKITAPIAL